MSMKYDETVLVLNGTGKTGRRVAARLTERGVPVRIGSRSGTPPFDWTERSTWEPALDGVGSAYVSFFPDLAVPGAVEAVGSFAELAVANDVRRLVLLSGRGEEEALNAEQALTASGADWTVVRASWFNQNFSEGFMRDLVLTDEVVLPASTVGEPFVDADDIADVAVAALTEDGHSGRPYEVTGPRLLTFAQAVAEIAAATGRDIRLVEVSSAEFATGLSAAGVPDEYVRLLTYLFDTVLDGRNASVVDGVRQALGREPREFADYARRAAASGVWQVDTAAA